MAEHNLFLGTARKSVGDVTLMRRAGRQLARVRLRTISNPKTEAQAIQRNFVAPVARFYAPLRKVLARSFEGLNKDQSYNRFQKVNIALARKEQWFLPKGAPWQPLPYQLSAGVLTPLVYSVYFDDESSYAKMTLQGFNGANPTIGEASRALVANGYHEGDVITFIFAVLDRNGSYNPYSRQFYVNTQSVELLSVLDVPGLQQPYFDNELGWEDDGANIVAFAALIASRKDGQWLRSTQYLVCASDYLSSIISQEAREAAIASYQAPNSDDGGGVYPGGDDNLFNVAAMDGRALLFVGGQYTAQTDGRVGEKSILLKPDNFDRYYYVKLGTDRYLGTNSAGSLSPSDWRGVAGIPAPADNSNTIDAPAGSVMRDYLASIGWVDS